MTAFQGAVDATFAAFGITPAVGEPLAVRVVKAPRHHHRLRRHPHPHRDRDVRGAGEGVSNPHPGFSGARISS
jgi:hypothetical protein